LERSFNPEASKIIDDLEQGREILLDQVHLALFGVNIEDEPRTFDEAWNCKEPDTPLHDMVLYNICDYAHSIFATRILLVLVHIWYILVFLCSLQWRYVSISYSSILFKFNNKRTYQYGTIQVPKGRPRRIPQPF
jgi:hypothetical protein